MSAFEPVPKPADYESFGGASAATVEAPAKKKSALPTRKLSYASVTAVVLFLISLFVTDLDPQTEQAVNVGLPLILAYFVKNADTPGGVPVAE